MTILRSLYRFALTNQAVTRFGRPRQVKRGNLSYKFDEVGTVNDQGHGCKLSPFLISSRKSLGCINANRLGYVRYLMFHEHKPYIKAGKMAV